MLNLYYAKIVATRWSVLSAFTLHSMLKRLTSCRISSSDRVLVGNLVDAFYDLYNFPGYFSLTVTENPKTAGNFGQSPQ